MIIVARQQPERVNSSYEVLEEVEEKLELESLKVDAVLDGRRSVLDR